MENKMNGLLNKESMDMIRSDCAVKQKKGIHFILASILIWTMITIIHMTNLDALSKNMFTFCATGPLVPLAYLISKILRIDFSDKTNPLSALGLLFAMNQMLYLLIAMWVYGAIPEKMLMVIAMIFGAHLLPFGWLYQSKSYYVAAVLIPFLALGVGLFFESYVLGMVMIFVEVIFSGSLILENKSVKKAKEVVTN
jgi:hypothetical protein